MYAIESGEPELSVCDCCDGLVVRHTRFVLKDGDAHGLYYAHYSNSHAEHMLNVLLVLGAWGEGTGPQDRTAFACRVRPVEDSFELMLSDVQQSVWAGTRVAGQRLSREEALVHPLKSEVFAVIDFALQSDGGLRGFLERVECGDASVPLERSFFVPDDVFKLGEDATQRCELLRNFVSLDGERFFVRCLCTIPVEDYGTWSVGTWIEVSGEDYSTIKAVWEELDKYAELRFEGTVANDLEVAMGLPVPVGTQVVCFVDDPNAPPRIEPPMSGELADLLGSPWPRDSFEPFAVANGLL